MADKTSEEYEKEIKELRAELEKLRSQIRLNLKSGQTFSAPGASFTIAGLEEMVLLVDDSGIIRFANSAMAILLGAKDKTALLKTRLAEWDQGILGPGFLSSLVESVKSTGQTCIFQSEFPDFPKGLLPGKASLNCPIILRFICCPVKDRIQIICQDVSASLWLEKTFSRYVSPKVIDRLRQIPVSDLLRVERKFLTVLFADLRGFTRVTQEIEPEQVCEMVNSYLSRMVECVEKYDGTVDKFIGDEIMATFGAPLAQKDHALRALLCAVDMIQAHQIWQEDQKQKGAPSPPVGIGIATGQVIVGNIGTEKQMDYTVLGHSVNLAARLCGKAEGLEILTTKETHRSALMGLKQGLEFKEVPHLRFEPAGNLDLKNVKEPVEVIRVIADLKKD